MTYMWPNVSRNFVGGQSAPFTAPYGARPGQQVPGQNLYYAPSRLGNQMQHNWAFSEDMVAPLMRGLPTPQVQAQAMRLSNEPFMMARPGSSGPRALGSAYTPATAGNQSQALRRRK